ncbi:MAG: DUF5596 domain-containing protein [Oscillibacter sp.]|nr:DUF5596 domain-containing protein [Oscillibacter sp.]
MMEARMILTLAEELALPEPVLEPLERAAEALPELPLEELAGPETAEAAWEAVKAGVPHWRQDDGMSHLAAALGGACHTRRFYRENGVPEDVFLATMGCFARFLRETHEITGRWAFDRGFWTWRQTGGLLFRLGTLEFEYRTLEEDEPLPEGLTAGERVLGVHIPSDASLKREELERSYDWAERFFADVPHGAPKAMVCDSWLLAPALEEMLPEHSGIRGFAGDYVRYAVEEDDRDFYRWLFQCEPPLPLEDLPERTGLQRAAKAWLAAGGKIGMAYGCLKRI